jgi:hypothetical protein
MVLAVELSVMLPVVQLVGNALMRRHLANQEPLALSDLLVAALGAQRSSNDPGGGDNRTPFEHPAPPA